MKIAPFFTGSLVLGADQLIKAWVVSAQPRLIVENPGLSFGLLGVSGPEAVGLSILALFLAVVLLRKTRPWLIGLVLAGAFSNLVDRVFRPGVIDYLGFGLWTTNLADLSIIVGLLGYGASVSWNLKQPESTPPR